MRVVFLSFVAAILKIMAAAILTYGSTNRPHKEPVTIKGINSNNYLCMNSSGILYGRVSYATLIALSTPYFRCQSVPVYFLVRDPVSDHEAEFSPVSFAALTRAAAFFFRP